MTFYFTVDKDACFAYWAQSLMKWGTYFYKKEFDFYTVFPYPLTTEEQGALSLLRTILEKRGHGYLWLWERYRGVALHNKEESILWEKIRLSLGSRFEKVWEVEYPLLFEWQKLLLGYGCDKKLETFLSRTAQFFGVNEYVDRDVEVRLVFCSDQHIPNGHTKREQKDFALLGLSRLNYGALDKVLSVLAHETVHLLENQSSFSWPLLRVAHALVLEGKINASKAGPSWRALLTESIITSMAGSRLGNAYFETISSGTSSISNAGTSERFDYKKYKENFGKQIIFVASQIVAATASYLDQRKQMDQEYANAVAVAWFRLVTE